MDFEQLFKELKGNLCATLGDKYAAYSEATKNDIEAFLEGSKDKLKRWTILLADERLNEEEFEWLIKSQKDGLILQAIYQAGVSKIALGHLKNKLIKVVLHTAKAAVVTK